MGVLQWLTLGVAAAIVIAVGCMVMAERGEQAPSHNDQQVERPEDQSQQAKRVAEEWLNDHLFDYESARIRWLSVTSWQVQAEVNAKNRFGAYVGWSTYNINIEWQGGPYVSFVQGPDGLWQSERWKAVMDRYEAEERAQAREEALRLKAESREVVRSFGPCTVNGKQYTVVETNLGIEVEVVTDTGERKTIKRRAGSRIGVLGARPVPGRTWSLIWSCDDLEAY